MTPKKHTVLFAKKKHLPHKHTTLRVVNREEECWREDLEPISKRRLAVLDPLEVASWAENSVEVEVLEL